MNKEELLKTIELARNKDQKAQSRLINYFWEDAFAFVFSKVQDRNTADEITVSVFSKVLAKLDLFDENFQFKTWILTIAQNTIIDFWRKKARESRASPENISELPNHFAQSPEELLISEEDEQNIFRTIESLSDGYREIIKLRFFEEKSIKEISEELNLSVANTKIRIMRAKKLLAELLKNSDLED